MNSKVSECMCTVCACSYVRQNTHVPLRLYVQVFMVQLVDIPNLNRLFTNTSLSVHTEAVPYTHT